VRVATKDSISESAGGRRVDSRRAGNLEPHKLRLRAGSCFFFLPKDLRLAGAGFFLRPRGRICNANAVPAGRVGALTELPGVEDNGQRPDELKIGHLSIPGATMTAGFNARGKRQEPVQSLALVVNPAQKWSLTPGTVCGCSSLCVYFSVPLLSFCQWSASPEEPPLVGIKPPP